MFVGAVWKDVENNLLVLTDDFVGRYGFGGQSPPQDSAKGAIEKILLRPRHFKNGVGAQYPDGLVRQSF